MTITEANTVYFPPKYLFIVLAFAGLSTMTRFICRETTQTKNMF